MKRNCANCNITFETTTTWQIYCSDRCRHAAFRKEQKKIIDEARKQRQKQSKNPATRDA